jgi:hypothetical protein
VKPQWLISLLQSPQPRPTLLRLVIVAALVLPLLIFFVKPTVDTLLPFYRAVFELIGDDYRILSLGLATQGADSVIRLDVTLAKPILLAGQFILPDERGSANVTTLVGHALQPLAVALIVLLAWPCQKWQTMALRLTVLVPLLIVTLAIDVPFVFAAELWGLFLDRLAPGTWSPMLEWSTFLLGGGRIALGLTAALVSVAIPELMSTKSVSARKVTISGGLDCS